MGHKYGSNIPEARDDLLEIADCLDDMALEIGTRQLTAMAGRVRAVVYGKMVRTSPDKTTRPRHPPPTPTQKAEVLYLRANTNMSQQEIAQRVGLNSGRVSEIIHEDKR